MEELINKTLSGDENAYAELIVLIKPYLIANASNRLKNSDDIEDAIQETIIKSYNNLHKLENKQHFKTWITRILINECNNINSNNKRNTTLFNKAVNKIGDSLYNDSNNSIDDTIFMEELLNKLDDDEKKIANLYFKDNFTTEKIAELLNSNKNTVKSKLHRIQLKLKKLAILLLILCIITTTTVFAVEIIKFIVSLFTTSRQAIDTAAQNNYVQNVNMDFVYDKNIGIKVDYILVDNKDLNISYVFDCKSNENISSVELVDYTIVDENNNKIYSKDFTCIANNSSDYGDILQIENGIFRFSHLYTTKNYFPFSTKLKFNINSISITAKNNFKEVSGNWIFEIDLENKFLNRDSENYLTSYSEYITNISTILDETCLTININLNTFANEDMLCNQLFYSNSVLENLSTKQKYDLISINSFNNKNNLGTIELKFDISKYTENINNLHLYLQFDDNKFIDINLNK